MALQLENTLFPRRYSDAQPKVTIGRLELWRLSGLALTNVRFTYGPPGTQQVFVVDQAYVWLNIISSIFGTRSFSFDIEDYKGALAGNVGLSSENDLQHLSATASNIDFAKTSFIASSFGIPLSGILNGDILLESGKSFQKDGNGHLKIKVNNLFIGPSKFSLPNSEFGGSLSVPKISLGKLEVDLSLDKGKAITKNISLLGKDAVADVKLELTLARNLLFSILSGQGWFELKDEFLTKNQSVKSLADLTLGGAGKGRRHNFRISGSLANPQAYLIKKPLAKKRTKRF